MKKKLKITADCVCDLPEHIRESYDIPIIYFYVITDSGSFKDRAEITTRNVMEYLEGEHKELSTVAPGVEEYRDFFAKELENCEELLHFSISAKMSRAYKHAHEAAGEFGDRVKVFDTENVSTGMGHMVLFASEQAKQGVERYRILEELQVMKTKVSASFVTENVHNLYITGRVSKLMDVVCKGLKLHPILEIKGGELKIGGILVGDFRKAVVRYIGRELKSSGEINKKRLFVTHCTCPVKIVNSAKQVAQSFCKFEQVEVVNVSATISTGCGPNTIGIMFVRQ